MSIIIYTDGSCTDNGKSSAKAGIGIYFPTNTYTNISAKFTLEPITNQRAELYAIYVALSVVSEKNITIYTDSMYSIKCLTEWIHNWRKNNWKTSKNEAVKNRDIIESIYELLLVKNVEFKHINSHQQNNSLESQYNNMADTLANQGRLL